MLYLPDHNQSNTVLRCTYTAGSALQYHEGFDWQVLLDGCHWRQRTIGLTGYTNNSYGDDDDGVDNINGSDDDDKI